MKLLALVLLCYAPFVLANDPHRDPPKVPPPVVIVQHDHDNNAAAAALIGAAVTWAVMCGHERNHPGAKTHKVCGKRRHE